MFPLRCSWLRASISKTSSTPLSTIATRFSSSAVTLTSIDFDMQSPHGLPSSGPLHDLHRPVRTERGARGGLDRAVKGPRAPPLGRQYSTAPSGFGRAAGKERSFLLVFFLQGFESGGVGERGDVAQRPSFRDVAEEAAHDLPRTGLREVAGEHDVVRAGQGADLA